MTIDQLIPGAVGGLIGVLLALAAVWLRGYLTEKGKNLATREDIQGISRLVEGVRGEMQALRDSQSRVRTTRHEALFAFAEPCLELLVHRLPASLGGFPMDGGKSLFEHQESMLAHCTKIQSAYFRLEILMPLQHPLILRALAVSQAAPRVATGIRQTFGAVKSASFDEEQVWKEGRHKGDPLVDAAVIAADAAVQRFRESVRDPSRELGQTFAAFRDELQKYLLALEGAG